MFFVFYKFLAQDPGDQGELVSERRGCLLEGWVKQKLLSDCHNYVFGIQNVC